MTSKSELIRAAVAEHHRLPLSKLMEVSGLQNRKKTLDLCVYMRGRGEVTIDRSGEEPIIGAGSGKPKKTPRAGGKKKHVKSPRKAVYDPRNGSMSMKQIVAKHVPESRTEALARIALQNLIASTEGLTATVRDQVEGIENNPSLRAQIEASERAAQMARLV